MEFDWSKLFERAVLFSVFFFGGAIVIACVARICINILEGKYF